MKISTRAQTPPFFAMDVLADAKALARSGRDILHMEVGEPSHPAPLAAQQAVSRAMTDGAVMGYTSGLGIPELREGIAALYATRHGISVDPERVVVTAGSSAGFSLTFLTLFEPGDRLALADPGYPCYRNVSRSLGLEPVRIEAGLDSGYQPTPALLDAAGELDGLLVASPANPTGSMLDREALGALVTHCADRDIALISDEIYHGLTYTEPAASALEFTDDVFIINSFSKYWSMTGWRIGWMVVPQRFVRTVQNLAQNFFICAPHVSQIAALGALSEAGEAEVNQHINGYAANRALLAETLPLLGFTRIAPSDGAFYAYADISGLAEDAQSFCSRLLHEAGIAITPGLDFDPVRGAQTVRFSYAQHPNLVAEAMERLRRFLRAGS
ncbi:MAG: aminotransferase class I/II-fold pyridoxal phosphate-dependent enzyme [Pseudomonadota bacterium]